MNQHLLGVMLLVGCWCLSAVMATIGRTYAARRLAADDVPGGHVLAAQLSGTALNRLLPGGVGLIATHIGLLRRRGTDGAAISAAVLGYGLAGLFAHALLLLAAVWTAVSLGVLPNAPVGLLSGAPVGDLLVPASLAVLTLALWCTFTRSAWMVRMRRTLGRAGTAVRRHPAAILRLSLLQTANQVLLPVALYGALIAVGAGVNVLALFAVFVVTNSLMSAVPAPGGTGPVEVGLLASLTLLGVGTAEAFAAVALFRAVTHWLPVPLGVLAGTWLLRRDLILPRGDRPSVRSTPGSAVPILVAT